MPPDNALRTEIDRSRAESLTGRKSKQKIMETTHGANTLTPDKNLLKQDYLKATETSAASFGQSPQRERLATVLLQ